MAGSAQRLAAPAPPGLWRGRRRFFRGGRGRGGLHIRGGRPALPPQPSAGALGQPRGLGAAACGRTRALPAGIRLRVRESGGSGGHRPLPSSAAKGFARLPPRRSRGRGAHTRARRAVVPQGLDSTGRFAGRRHQRCMRSDCARLCGRIGVDPAHRRRCTDVTRDLCSFCGIYHSVARDDAGCWSGSHRRLWHGRPDRCC
mmetsp:Transcript_108602/g.346703  ORF Transcript_108602/g.346703 Transcript_108602/m.346703 type:complete len:200 (+) Transcript_108602:1383-1982(+)